MNSRGQSKKPACRKGPRRGRACLAAIIVCIPLLSTTAEAAPDEKRDPNAYSGGYENSGMPGLEKADQIAIGTLVGDQLEFVAGKGLNGAAWDVYAWYGPDTQKLWVRSEGGVESDGIVDFTTSAEALWWRAFSPFWATVLGVRQDFGPGWLTYAALGVEGLTPYWLRLEATGYVGRDGTLSARLKGFYDVLLTNRLILTPEVETNLYSKAQPERAVGAGWTNIELAVRLRYEFVRKFAPYAGFDWDRALFDTVDRRRAKGQPVSDTRFVAGLRLWW